MQTIDIKKEFLQFFKSKGHKIIPYYVNIVKLYHLTTSKKM